MACLTNVRLPDEERSVRKYRCRVELLDKLIVGRVFGKEL